MKAYSVYNRSRPNLQNYQKILTWRTTDPIEKYHIFDTVSTYCLQSIQQTPKHHLQRFRLFHFQPKWMPFQEP